MQRPSWERKKGEETRGKKKNINSNYCISLSSVTLPDATEQRE